MVVVCTVTAPITSKIKLCRPNENVVIVGHFTLKTTANCYVSCATESRSYIATVQTHRAS